LLSCTAGRKSTFTMTDNPSFLIKPNPEQLIQSAAARLAEYAEQCVAERGRFSFALSGGSTPKAFYELLADEPWRSNVPWKQTIILFGDERAVPHDDERSNYRMAAHALL